MTRARQALHAACGLALIGAWLLWWLPAITLRLGQLAAGRLRFRAVVALADALKAVGRRDAAWWIYWREAERCRVKVAAIRARRGW